MLKTKVLYMNLIHNNVTYVVTFELCMYLVILQEHLYLKGADEGCC